MRKISSKLFNSKTPADAYRGLVWRMVESQETAATLRIVDSMEEQAVLEALLDDVKPKYRVGTEHMHFLFKTAFRYPPLKYGSRFGTRLMPSFYYASEQIETALAETAYYRLVFLQHMDNPYPHPIDSWHCLFSTRVKADSCLDLCDAKFKGVKRKLLDSRDYRYSQRVGEWAVMERKVQMIRCYSARRDSACNVAIAEPKVISSKKPEVMESWLCRTHSSKISFFRREKSTLMSFLREDFLVDGVFPAPAPS